MKILQYYKTVFEAEVVRGRLASEGIEAIVHNAHLPYLNEFSTISPYLEVADEDFDRAVAILGETQGGELEK